MLQIVSNKLAPTPFSIFPLAMIDEASRYMVDGYTPSRQSANQFNEMQKIVDAFSDVTKKFGLKINIKKTEVLYQLNSTTTREEDIMVDGNKLNSVMEFTCIRSTISSNGCIDDEIQTRIAKSSAYSVNYASVSGSTTMCPGGIKARHTVQSCCPPSYMEPRPGQCRRQVNKLYGFMMQHMLSIMRKTWMDKVTNKDIIERTGLPSITTF